MTEADEQLALQLFWDLFRTDRPYAIKIMQEHNDRFGCPPGARLGENDPVATAWLMDRLDTPSTSSAT